MLENQGIVMVNDRCFYCGKNRGMIVLDKRLPKHSKKLEELKNEVDGKVVDTTPCSECKEFMAKGVILITYDEEKSDFSCKPPNFYRTGGFFVVTDEYINRLFGEFNRKFGYQLLQARYGFIPHQFAENLGFFEYSEQQEESKDE